MYRRVRPQRHRAEQRRAARLRTHQGGLRIEPLRGFGHSGRRGYEAAARVPDLDGSQGRGASRMGAQPRRPRATLCSDRQRRRQLLRLHQDAVAARQPARRLGEDASLPAPERLRGTRPYRKGRGRPFLGRQHRRHLRCRAPRLVARDDGPSRHSDPDDAAATGGLHRSRRGPAAAMERDARPAARGRRSSRAASTRRSPPMRPGCPGPGSTWP